MSYVTPRSIQNLEDEIAELEKGTTPQEVIEEKPVVEEVVPAGETLTKEEETWKKRYSDLRRSSQKQADEVKRLAAEVENLSKTKASELDLSSPEEAAKWAKENPHAASIIRALANEQVVNTAPKSDDVAAIRNELEKNKQEARILKVHPDFEDITSDDKFHDWAETQTQSVQKLIYEGDAEDVIWALSLYKKEEGSEGTNPKREAAKSVVSKVSSAPAEGGKKAFTESQVQKMSMSEYEKNEVAIQESMRNGSFVYDLSGAAR